PLGERGVVFIVLGAIVARVLDLLVAPLPCRSLFLRDSNWRQTADFQFANALLGRVEALVEALEFGGGNDVVPGGRCSRDGGGRLRGGQACQSRQPQSERQRAEARNAAPTHRPSHLLRNLTHDVAGPPVVGPLPYGHATAIAILRSTVRTGRRGACGATDMNFELGTREATIVARITVKVAQWRHQRLLRY